LSPLPMMAGRAFKERFAVRYKLKGLGRRIVANGVKLRCDGYYPADDWIVGGEESLEVGPKRRADKLAD